MKNDLANALASGLDAIEQDERSRQEVLAQHPELRDELAPLLATARAIQSRADFAPRPEFLRASPGRLRQRLASRRKSWGFQQFALQLQIIFAGRLAAPAKMILLIVGLLFASTSTVYAAAGALPGDALYPVKLAVESARLFVSDGNDMLLQIEFLETRMGEMERLAALGREKDLARAAESFSESISAAAKSVGALVGKENHPEQAVLLENALLIHSERLNVLLETVPEQARPGLQRALENSNHGRQALYNLFPDSFPELGSPIEKKTEDTFPDPSHGQPENLPEPAQSPSAGSGHPEDKNPDNEKAPPAPGGPPDGLPRKTPGTPGNRP